MLRRSPRFVQQVQPVTDVDPKTPKLERSRRRGSYSDVTPLSSFQKGSSNKSLERKKGKCLKKGKEAYLKPKNCTLSSIEQWKLKNGERADTHCLRRSPRFSAVCNVKGSGYEEYKQDDFSKPGIQRRVEVSEKETHFGPKNSKKLRTELGISRRLDGVNKISHCSRRSYGFPGDGKDISNEDSKRDDLSKTERVFDLPRKSDVGISRRVTRGFFLRCNEKSATGNGNKVIGSIPGELVVDVQKRLDEQKITAGTNSSKQCLYKVEKRVTRSASYSTQRMDIKKCGDCKGEKPIKNVSFECLDKWVSSHSGNDETEKVSSEQCIRRPVNGQKRKNGLSARKRIADEGEKKRIGMRRKRDEAKEEHRIVQGWTREQELALERAYLVAKPTPRFWKKVSKMVPGKSAQDCFDKIHSDHLTPRQPQPRTREKSTNLSSFSLSASKLLTSPEPKHKKLRNTKQKNFLSHKAVRGLLQRQCKRDQDDEADLFTVLEPTLDPSIRVIPDGTLFSTPECYKRIPGFPKRCLERSSSAQRKHLPHLSASGGASLTSPPVLKQVKNKALHEKYIDQLHTREVKRKAASLLAAKCIQGKNNAKPNDVQSSEVIKAAKNALIVDAREAIGQFQHLRNSMENDDDDDDDVFDDIAEDDIEYGS